MKKQTIRLKNGSVTGYCISLGNASLLIIQARTGYLMCGYLDINAANKLGDIAGKVTGVKTFDDMLNATVMEVSENAKKAGLLQGLTGEEFLSNLL
jgi:uncharacterized protein YunC (DUF1805 family)